MEQQLINKLVGAMEIEAGDKQFDEVDIVIDIMNRTPGQIPEGNGL